MSASSSEPHGGDGPSDDEVDRRFAELTDGLDIGGLESIAGVGDLDQGAPDTPSGPPGRTEAADESAPPSGEPRTGSGPRDYSLAEEPEEPFEAPEPESLATADPLRLGAWALAIGGPVLLLVLTVVWSSAPPLVWLTLLGATLLGWGVALWRLPRARDDDDDGAVV